MLSFGKILLLVAVALGVMIVWRWLKARERVEEDQARRGGGARRRAVTQDMEPCPGCGTFVPVGSGACGRPECPASKGKSRV